MFEILFKLQPNNYLSMIVFFIGAFLIFAAYTTSKGNYKFSAVCQSVFPNRFIEESVYRDITKKYNFISGSILVVLSVIGQFIYEPWQFFLSLFIGCFVLIMLKGKVEYDLKTIIYDTREEKKTKKSSNVIVSESTGATIEEFVD